MKYLIKNKDGSVTVMTMAMDVTPESCIEKWSEEMQGNVESVRAMDESEVPSDRHFRNAWRHKKNNIVIDMPAAIEIHKDNLRAMRKPLLEALDVESVRAMEKGDAKAMDEIKKKKQELRDVTSHRKILECKSPDMLKTLIPECLM